MKKLLVILMMVSLIGLSTGAFAQVTAPVASGLRTEVLRLDCGLSGQGPTCSPFDFQTGDSGGRVLQPQI